MQSVLSRGYSPFFRLRIPDAELGLTKVKFDLGVLAGLEEHLFETTENFRWLACRRGERDVSLRNFSAVDFASVPDIDGGTDQRVVLLTALLDLELVVLKGGVGKTVAEWEKRFNVIGVKVAVADVKLFGVLDLVLTLS